MDDLLIETVILAMLVYRRVADICSSQRKMMIEEHTLTVNLQQQEANQQQ